MEQTINDKQKKLLLVLPLLALPFATLFFWSLGGGKSANAQSAAIQTKGLNMKLPGAKLKNDSTANKLSFYEQAERDSAKYKQARKDDPYYKGDTSPADTPKHPSGIIGSADSFIGKDNSFQPKAGNSSRRSLAANEQAINQRLADLNRQINQPAPVSVNTTAEPAQNSVIKTSGSVSDDPDMKQLNGMLDKIMDIENPGIARQKQKEASEKNRGQVFAVSTPVRADPLSTLENTTGSGVRSSNIPVVNGFYSAENLTAISDSQNTIRAVIHETQTITSGSTVKFRLADDVFINGVLVPKDNMIYGVASLEGERLQVKINSIRYHNSLFPVSLAVYDLDGLDGIYIPGAIARDVAKESADQGIQNIGVTSLDPSLGAQAAAAGVTAAKSLFSRKIRLIRVQVKAGYEVLLKDEKQKQFNQ